MPKFNVTWLGADEEFHPNPGPSFGMWNGVRFDKDKPTLLDTDIGDANRRALIEHMLKKMHGNKLYRVEPVQEKHHVNVRDPR